MSVTLDDLVLNGFAPTDALALLDHAGDLELVELPHPLEFLTDMMGLSEDEAVDLLCDAEQPLENAFYSPSRRRWFFARDGFVENQADGEELDPEDLDPTFLQGVLEGLGVGLVDNIESSTELLEILDEVGREIGEDVVADDAYYSAATGQWFFSDGEHIENEAAEDPEEGAAAHYQAILDDLGVALHEPTDDPAELREILVEAISELGEGEPTENKFASDRQRKWYFANRGKKGGPVDKKGGDKGGKGGGGAAPGKSAIAEEKTTAPPPGKYFQPDVAPPKGGMAKAARVGVPADEVPPPPKVPRLPNLTRAERKAESEFAKAYEKDPDGMAKRYLEEIAKADTPPKFETDAAKLLSPNWVDADQGKQAQKRAHFNTALHQTANAVTKRSFLQYLDTLKPGDEILVTNGGCGCHVADTPIMMADGSLKMVQDIEVGDELMGPDSRPRRVLRLIRGKGVLHRVVPKKGKSWVVNEDHVLSLYTPRAVGSQKRTRSVMVNMTVREYLNQSDSKRRNCYLYRAPVDFPTRLVPLDPYFLGVWLGNGLHCGTSITTRDREIVEYLEGFSQQFPGTELVSFDKQNGNKAKDYKIALLDKHPGKGNSNPVRDLLKAIGVFRNKHIPEAYLRNDRETRLRLLAGLLDTDGSYDHGGFEFSTKSERTAYDVAYLSRSLGFAAYIKPKVVDNDFTHGPRTYWRVTINGDVDQIPTRVRRKQASPRRINKNPLRVGFHTEPVGRGDFYGFTLEGDGLYLLDDFTVTHNSGKGFALKNVPEAKALKERSKAVWDSAGDQNATENSWIQAEAEKRGLKVNYAFVHADPKKQWADPERGVVKRASDPADGRMVDAAVFADSYAHGVRNMDAFVKANKDNPNASFTFLDNTGKPKLIDGIPKEAFVDRDEIYQTALKTVKERQEVPAHIKRGATVGERIWRGE